MILIAAHYSLLKICCRPDVYLAFDPEGYKIHPRRFSRTDSQVGSIYDAVKAM